MGGFFGWLSGSLPSFDDLRASNRQHARGLSKAEARRQLVEHPVMGAPAAAHLLAEALGYVDGTFDQAARERCDVLIGEAVRATGYDSRPGNVEALWTLEGLFDRFLDDWPKASE